MRTSGKSEVIGGDVPDATGGGIIESMSGGGRTEMDSFAKRHASEFTVWLVVSVVGWALTKSLWLPIYVGWMMIATRVAGRLLPEQRADWLVHLVPAPSPSWWPWDGG